MSVVFMDGFDYYATNFNNTSQGVLSNWVGGPVSNTCILSPGRWGDGSYVRLASMPMLRYVPAGITEYSFGCGMYLEAKNANNVSWYHTEVAFGELGGNNRAVSLDFRSDGSLRVRIIAAGHNAGTYANVVAAHPGFSQWFYLEVECKIANSGGYVRIYINSTLVYNYSGDTQGASGELTLVYLCFIDTVSDGTTRYDDLYLTDSGVRLGEMRIQTLYPVADTADADWTPSTGTDHYALIDEVPPDGDTTYLEADTNGDLDMFEFTDLAEVPYKIEALQLVTSVRKTDAGTRSVKTVVDSGGTVVESDEKFLSGSYTYKLQIFSEDPDTTAAWTQPKVNNLLAGIKVHA